MLFSSITLILLFLLPFFGFADFDIRDGHSDDLAVVVINTEDGKLVEVFTRLIAENIFLGHYKSRNVVVIRQKELWKCSWELEASGAIGCLNGEARRDISASSDLLPRSCAFISKVTQKLRNVEHLDFYVLGHHAAGAMRIQDEVFEAIPGFRKKARLFYTTGCSEGDYFKWPTSRNEILKRGGFTGILAHEGTSLSPFVLSGIIEKFYDGKGIGQVAAEINKDINTSAILSRFPGTKLVVFGDLGTSLHHSVDISHPAKACLRADGRETLNELRKKGCITATTIFNYVESYPYLIDREFCASITSDKALDDNPEDQKGHSWGNRGDRLQKAALIICAYKGYAMDSYLTGETRDDYLFKLKEAFGMARGYLVCMPENLANDIKERLLQPK